MNDEELKREFIRPAATTCPEELLEDEQQSGWICPRCQVVHAPWVAKCDCEPKALASVGPSEFK